MCGANTQRVQRIGGDHADSEQAMFVRLYEIARTTVQHRIWDVDEREDLAQNSIVVTLDALRSGRIRDPSHVERYLRGVLRVLSAEYMRKKKLRMSREVLTDAIEAYSDSTQSGNSPLKAAVADERASVVHSAIGRLRQRRDRLMLRYRYLDEFDSERVARFAKVSTQQLHRALHRARNRLREQLEGAEVLTGAGVRGQAT